VPTEADDSGALTLGELVDEAARQLAEAGVDNPDDSARRIGEAAVGLDPTEFATSRGVALTQRMVSHADAMLKRRAAGEPLQYVVGSWSFRYLDLAVDRRALIPRPETEVVAGVGIDALRELGRQSVAVDLGTGTGAIALSIAGEVPAASVYATDRSAEALALARANLAGLGRAGARVALAEGSWFEPLDRGLRGSVDLLISNPPYVAESDELPDAVAHWEPSEALFAGPDGFDDLELLIIEGRPWLAGGGLLVLECAPQQAAAVAALAGRRGYDSIEVVPDLAGQPRALSARRPIDDAAADQRERAAEVLRAGGLVVAPTDTVPGLLARHDDETAVRLVYSTKQRPADQPLPVLVSGPEQASQLVELSDRAIELAHRHWPGALTLVADRRGGAHPVHGHSTLGVRVPALGWLRELIDDVGPVTGSSANLHAAPTPVSAREAAAQLSVGDWIDGSAGGGEPSTVVDATGDDIVVLRHGAVAPEDIAR
jgi:release factor glutamine methyltransferase